MQSLLLWFCSLRKNADDLRKALESIVIPVFSTAFKYGTDDKRQKLLKVKAKSASDATVSSESRV